MKRIMNILAACFAEVLPTMAQVDIAALDDTEQHAAVPAADAECNAEQSERYEVVRPKLTREILAESERESEAARIIDLPMGSNPMSKIDMAMPFGFHSPWGYGGPGIWSLHEGLNVDVGFSVTSGLGKNRIKGAGFGEHIAAAYAMPFGKDKRWIGAFGVYADRLDWGGYSRTEAGVSGVLGYHVNDWCNVYVYGSYNFVPGRDNGAANPYAYSYACSPYGYPFGYGGYPYGCGYDPFGYGYGCGYGYGNPYGPYANLRGRIGGAAEFKIGDSSYFRISAEYSVYDRNNHMPGFFQPPMPEPADKPYGVNDAPVSKGRGSNGRR